MLKHKRSLCLLLVLLMSASLFGCAQTMFTGFENQSHFDYPNSNVVPIKHVRGEASKSAIFSFPFVSSDLQEEAINNALRQAPGADLLINYMEFQRRSSFLFVHTLTYIVEGTAATMEIGTKKLN